MLNKSQWISCPGLPEKGCVVFYARKRWQLAALPASAMLKISADSRFRLWINDIFVGSGPVRGSTVLNFHEVFEIAPLLRIGENEFFAEVWSQREENFVFHSLEAALWAEVRGMLYSAPGDGWEVKPARGWRSDVPHYTLQSGFMEWYDFREETQPESWCPAITARNHQLLAKKLLPNPLPAFPESSLRPVEALSWYAVGPLDIFDAHRIPDVLSEEPHMALSPERIVNPSALFSGKGAVILRPSAPGEGLGVILDFASEVSGRLEIELDAPAGTTLQIAYGEALSGGRIATKFSMDYHFTDAFILKDGRNLVTTAFSERGFRMVAISIRNFDRPIRLERVSGINRRYPFMKRGSFFSSDYRLNRIFEVCTETLSACASDVFMDCPWRERAFWVNDLLVNNLATLHCFGASELHRHCLELAFSQPHPSELLSAVVPMPKMAGQCDFIFAPTNLYMMLILKDYWHFSGDDATVRRYLPDIERIFNAIWRLADSDGILRTTGVTAEWNFYDWSFEENHLCCNNAGESMLSSLYLIASSTFEEVATALGHDFDRSELQRRRALTARNFETRFFSEESGLIEDELRSTDDLTPVKRSTQLAHALWLLTGEASPRVAEICRKAISDESLLKPDYYLHYFWFQAAASAGKAQEALDRIRRYWGRCIDTGSPTLYEAGIHTFGKQAMDGSGSLCHAFGTIPVAFLHEVILGVRALAPGFREFSFAPNRFDLDFAEGRIPVPVPSGCIRVRLTVEYTELTVPAGCTAVLPNGVRLNAGFHKLKAT